MEAKQTNTKNNESNGDKRYWQKFRGWSIMFCDDLLNSAGKTTRMIADATFCSPRVAAVILQRMLRFNLIEKVENWGWRLTQTGKFLLSLNNNNTVNNKPVNMKVTGNEHNIKPKQPERIPSCFRQAVCHIKQVCKDKAYNLKNMKLCPNCVHFDVKAFTKVRSST